MRRVLRSQITGAGAPWCGRLGRTALLVALLFVAIPACTSRLTRVARVRMPTKIANHVCQLACVPGAKDTTAIFLTHGVVLRPTHGPPPPKKLPPLITPHVVGCINLKSGDLQWMLSSQEGYQAQAFAISPSRGEVAIVEERILRRKEGTRPIRARFVDAASGAHLRTLGGPETGCAASEFLPNTFLLLEDKKTLIMPGRGYLYGLDTHSGETLWKQPVPVVDSLWRVGEDRLMVRCQWAVSLWRGDMREGGWTVDDVLLGAWCVADSVAASPDGERVVAVLDDIRTKREWELWLAELPKGTARLRKLTRLRERRYAEALGWHLCVSQDGRFVAFTWFQRNYASVYQFTGGSTVARVGSVSAGPSWARAAWSPTGKLLLAEGHWITVYRVRPYTEE